MITIILPWPDKRLNPNARLDRRALIGVKATAKQEAWMLSKSAIIEKFQVGRNPYPFSADEIPLELEFCPPDKRHRDRDNCLASCKAALDGVAEALGVNDERFEPIILRRGRVVEGGQVILRIGA